MLIDASQQDAEFRFGDTLVGIEADGHGVDVTFERGAPDRFDLVVGADGRVVLLEDGACCDPAVAWL